MLVWEVAKRNAIGATLREVEEEVGRDESESNDEFILE